LAVLIVTPPEAAAVEVLDDAAVAAVVAAAAVFELELGLEALPHPATAIAEIASATMPATRNVAVLNVTIIAPGLVALTHQIGAVYL
jgi:hypothetical protein